MRIAAAVVLAIAASQAQACGACDEDKVAVTYDHAVVRRAVAAKQVVVFCSVQGPMYELARAQRIARRTPGLDAASVRTSSQPPTLSYAVDHHKRSVERATSALQRGAPAGTRLSVVRIVA